MKHVGFKVAHDIPERLLCFPKLLRDSELFRAVRHALLKRLDEYSDPEERWANMSELYNVANVS